MIENQGLLEKNYFCEIFYYSNVFDFFDFLKPKKLKRDNRIKAREIFIMTLDQSENPFPLDLTKPNIFVFFFIHKSGINK